MKRSISHRQGFTLVELLTVIIIIGFLAAMIAGVAPAVMKSVKETAIRAEIQQLSMALEAYKAEYGEYPPDGTDPTAVTKHIRRCYPEAEKTEIYGGILITPQNALCIFLGPHNANPREPFAYNPYNLKQDKDKNMTKAFFDFDPTRSTLFRNPEKLAQHEVLGTFTPSGCTVPYIYMKARGLSGKKYYDTNSYTAYKDSEGNWYNPETYQIISAGLDDNLGNTGTVTVTKGISSEIHDNIVNFGKKTVGDLLD